MGIVGSDLSLEFGSAIVALLGVLLSTRQDVLFKLTTGAIETTWSMLWFKFKKTYHAVQIKEIRVSGMLVKGEPHLSLIAILVDGKPLSVAYDLSAMNLVVEDAERISKSLESPLVIGSSYYDIKRFVMGASSKSAQLSLIAAIVGCVVFVVGVLIVTGAIPISRADLTEKSIQDNVTHRQIVGFTIVYLGGVFGILGAQSWCRYKRRPRL